MQRFTGTCNLVCDCVSGLASLSHGVEGHKEIEIILRASQGHVTESRLSGK